MSFIKNSIRSNLCGMAAKSTLKKLHLTKILVPRNFTNTTSENSSLVLSFLKSLIALFLFSLLKECMELSTMLRSIWLRESSALLNALPRFLLRPSLTLPSFLLFATNGLSLSSKGPKKLVKSLRDLTTWKMFASLKYDVKTKICLIRIAKRITSYSLQLRTFR